MLTANSQAPQPGRRKLRLAFICVENANRSQMAEAFARAIGGTVVEACSAGSRPSGTVNPKAIESMRRAGYDLASHASKSTDALTGEFEAIVTMGCGDACPNLPAHHRIEWEIPDPKHLAPAEFDQVRDLIARKVRDLLAELRAARAR